VVAVSTPKPQNPKTPIKQLILVLRNIHYNTNGKLMGKSKEFKSYDTGAWRFFSRDS